MLLSLYYVSERAVRGAARTTTNRALTLLKIRCFNNGELNTLATRLQRY